MVSFTRPTHSRWQRPCKFRSAVSGPAAPLLSPWLREVWWQGSRKSRFAVSEALIIALHTWPIDYTADVSMMVSKLFNAATDEQCGSFVAGLLKA